MSYKALDVKRKVRCRWKLAAFSGFQLVSKKFFKANHLPRFQGKPFNITVTQVYAPTSNAEEVEVERIYEDLQDLLELTPKKDVLFIIGDWNAKVGSQSLLPGVTGKFGFGIQNEAGQRLTEFCQENALVIANIFQQHKRRLYTRTSPDG